MSELNIPESWVEVDWEEIIEISGGSQPPKSDFKNSPAKEFVRLLQIRDFGSDKDAVYIPKSKASKVCSEDDILIGRYGASIGRICTGKAGAYNVALAKVIYPKNYILKSFMEYHLRCPTFQGFITNIGGRAAQAGFNKEDLASLKFPLPNLIEQERIVQKIETCFEKIDSTEANLNKAEKLLEKYRESLLAKAFRGELVPQDPNDEPASVLLEKIRKERAQNQKGKKAEQEFAPIADDEKPFDLPAGWEWVRFGEIIKYARYGTSEKCAEVRKKQDIPILRMGNIQNGLLDISNLKFLIKSKVDTSLMLNKGDILFNRTNSLEHVGKSAVFNLDGEWSYAGYLISVKVYMGIDPQFIVFFINSNFGRAYIEKVATNTGQAQSNVNAEKMKMMLIPLPPTVVQNKISSMLQNGNEKIKLQNQIVKREKTCLSLIKESILNKAFEGRLVEQIPSEGTGQELLEKILIEKNTKIEKETKVSKVSSKTPTKSKGHKNGKK